MSQEAANLADIKSSKDLNIMKDFYRQKRQKQGSYTRPKVDWLWQGSFPLGDGGRLSGRLRN